MYWIENKYVGLISGRLERFTRVNNNTYTFRCPFCGDSKNHKSKTRGYIYNKESGLRFYCHNCGSSMGFSWFIKKLDPTLYLEFVKEKLLDSGGKKSEFQDFVDKMKKPSFISNTSLKQLKKISQLSSEHPAKKYVESRKIPSEVHYRLFYAPRFKEWVNSIIPNKIKDEAKEEPRLIIPFIDKEGNLFGFQGRSFRSSKNALRYVTIMLDENKPKIFGLDKIDDSKTIYAVEGPIDSLFLKNAIASAGGNIISEIGYTSLPKDNIIVLYDNEPRNPHTIEKIETAIDNGYKVSIFSNKIEHKDINEMVLNGIPINQIHTMIDENTFKGAEAKLFLTYWRRDKK
jgi:transcription elongation factor Elf1